MFATSFIKSKFEIARHTFRGRHGHGTIQIISTAQFIWTGRILGKTLGSAPHRALVYLLIAKREAAGMTQAELAEKMGEYQSFIARLESGQRRIDVVEFLEIAAILGFDSTKAIKSIVSV